MTLSLGEPSRACHARDCLGFECVRQGWAWWHQRRKWTHFSAGLVTGCLFRWPFLPVPHHTHKIISKWALGRSISGQPCIKRYESCGFLPLAQTILAHEACFTGNGVVSCNTSVTRPGGLPVGRTLAFSGRGFFFSSSHRRESALAEFVERERSSCRCLRCAPARSATTGLHKHFSFETVAAPLLSKEPWNMLYTGCFHHVEAGHQLEAKRSLVISQALRCHHHPHVLVGDNLGVVLALSKSRCASCPLVRL